MSFAGGVSALPGAGVWPAAGALPLCPGLPPEDAARGGRRGPSWAAEPDAHGRPNQHRLGGLGRGTPSPGFQVPACLELLPVTSKDTSQHARSLPFFKQRPLIWPKGRERSAHCWPTWPCNSFILPRSKAMLFTQKAAHPFPPFLFYNKSPFIGCSKIRSWVWYFKLRTLKH